jgi:leucyl aminopeptidase
VFEVPPPAAETSTEDFVTAVTRSAILSSYKFDRYLTGDDAKLGLRSVVVELQRRVFDKETWTAAEKADAEAAFNLTKTLADGTLYARDLTNERVRRNFSTSCEQ